MTWDLFLLTREVPIFRSVRHYPLSEQAYALIDAFVDVTPGPADHRVVVFHAPSTTIRYGLPNRSRVTLTVFNTLGQQVAQLVNGDMEAGYHEVKFDGSKLASGVYLYRIHAGSYVETKKLLLVR